MRLFSLFTGIGAPEKALQRLGISYELVGFSEIDKYASRCYMKIFDVLESLNYGDIRDIDEKTLPYFDLITWGFPCTNISVAGKQSGIKKGNPSGLYYDGIRILREKKPKYSILENVKNLTGKRFKYAFKMILRDLENAGYTNYWQVLNAKDYGVPQNRERVFIVSIRNDVNHSFAFPDKEPLHAKLKDLLEDDVPDKYYLSDRLIKCFSDTTNRNGFIRAKRFKPHGEDSKYAFTITTAGGGRVNDNYIKVPNPHNQKEHRIRKLTPLECWRLMDFDDEDFFKTQSLGISNTQLYKMAGNSIVVRVLEKIFENLFMWGEN